MLSVEQVAQVAHEINQAYCLATGDNSQPSWADAPDWQKSSAINGVKMHLANPDATPEDSHKSWLKQKTEEGWSYGPVKNPETKEHPCFIPYDQLPESQRAKDYLFRQVIHSLAPLVRREKTEGQAIMNVSFNPGGNVKVDKIKLACADLWDLISDSAFEHFNSLPEDSHFAKSQTMRLAAVAKTELEGCQMWAVKAVTR